MPEGRNLFPRSSRYKDSWIVANSLGEPVLYNLESLCEILPLAPTMRTMDLGCGRAISSIFLAREFGVQVWAIDNEISPSENYGRVLQSGSGPTVFPLKVDAASLPFPDQFFDAIIAADSYYYFGTDEKFTTYIARFLRTGGHIGIVDICFTREINALCEAPPYLRPVYEDDWHFVHSVEWWRHHLEKTGLFRVTRAELLPQSQFIRQQYISGISRVGKKDAFAETLAMDEEGVISFFRLVARRTDKACGTV